MNERIRQLAVQAELKMCSCGCDMPTRQSAKFAELIVREMLDIFDKRAEPGTGFYEPREPAEMIRQHFGVEE